MFKTLLIANRGEIALRVIRGCRRLGVRTVAVYSEADRSAPHVALADAACLIGPPDAARSYLDVGAIISATRRYHVAFAHDRITLGGSGRHRTWRRLSRWTRALTGAVGAAQKGTGIVAPMPGAVIAVNTFAGACVEAGEVLILLEAMKMIQSLSAPVAGTVQAVRCRLGDTVKGGAILIEIEAEEKGV